MSHLWVWVALAVAGVAGAVVIARAVLLFVTLD